MKAIIKSVVGNESNFDIAVDVFEDNGDFYFSKTMGVICNEKDVNLAVEYAKKVIAEVIAEHSKEQDSVTKSEIQKLVGVEIQF